jgi:hypothetical protein
MRRGSSQTHPAEADPRVLAITVNEDIEDAGTLATACIDRFVEDGNPDDVDIAAGLLREVVEELEALRALSPP